MSLPLDQLLKRGEALYLEKFRTKLEKSDFGKYAVIDVENERYVIDEDKLAAVEKATADFGDNLFYIVQIGNLDTPTKNFRGHALPAWGF